MIEFRVCQLPTIAFWIKRLLIIESALSIVGYLAAPWLIWHVTCHSLQKLGEQDVRAGREAYVTHFCISETHVHTQASSLHRARLCTRMGKEVEKMNIHSNVNKYNHDPPPKKKMYGSSSDARNRIATRSHSLLLAF